MIIAQFMVSCLAQLLAAMPVSCLRLGAAYMATSNSTWPKEGSVY